MSADQASSTASGSMMDPVRALQHALYRAAKADPGTTVPCAARTRSIAGTSCGGRGWTCAATVAQPGIDRTTIADVEEYGVTRLLDEVAGS